MLQNVFIVRSKKMLQNVFIVGSKKKLFPQIRTYEVYLRQWIMPNMIIVERTKHYYAHSENFSGCNKSY